MSVYAGFSADAATHCTNNNNHSMVCGKIGKWFNSRQDIENYAKQISNEMYKKVESGEMNWGTYAAESPSGYECWNCAYCGKWTGNFKYTPEISLSYVQTYYNGSVKKPNVIIETHSTTLTEGVDYKVTYAAGRKNVGRYAVKIDFIGNYCTGYSKTLYFNIIPKGVSGITSAVSKPEGFAVQWAKQTTQTTGYEVQYSTNSNMSGAKTIVMPKPDYYAKTVTGLGANKIYYVRVRTYTKTKFNGKDYNVYSPWCAVKSVKTSAYRSAVASLSLTSTYYTGKVKTPGVTVKDKSSGKVLKNGTDYTVSYASGRKNVGRYAVKITYKGNYKGTQTLYFNIIPKGVSKINSVKAKSKGFTVNWTKQQTQTTGYQIQYSTNKNMSGAKTITMPKNTYYAKNITKLKGNTRYYVRIRTYKVTKFNGKNYNIYSPWCTTKTVTTKR